MLTTVILGIEDLLLFFYAPAWLMLMVSPWLSDDLPFALPIAYVFFLAVAGVASVFSYWHSMDKETESLQRRLRVELRTIKEKYKEESNKWNKKMESERALLTELKQREQQRAKELEIAKKEADAANKAKSDFLAIISHEIRTPMNGILGVLQIIEKTPLSEKQSEYIEIIKNSGDTMLTLLNDILDYSKIENGAIDLEYIDFSLRKLANSVSMLMQGRAEASGLNVIVDIAEDIPDTYNSDVGRIRQILLNLVSNAIKFTERGSVTIKISKQFDSPFTLLFEVIDTGMGISEEGQSKLFQAYAQADSSITRRFGGTGLGLNICRMLVNAMNGQIGVKSEVGKGSNFWFDLPLSIANTTLTETTREAVAEYKPAKQIYALVIDDNEVNLKIINSFLEMDGHEAVTATSAMRGLQLIEQDRFDVVFVDMIMPEMDGKAFVAKLRQNGNATRAHLPVIALTGLTAKEDIDDMQAIGMRDIIIKPVSQAMLRQSIDRLVLNPDFGGDIKLPDIMARLDDLSDNEKAELRDALKSPHAAQSFTTDKPALNIEMMKELKSSLPVSTLKELFDDLIEKSKELTDEIEKDLISENFENLGRNGHNIQGMAGNFGLTLLADHSRDIERAVRDGDNEKAAALAKDSRQILDYSLSALDEWLKS
jgi:TMAO reductase system sensor TorS